MPRKTLPCLPEAAHSGQHLHLQTPHTEPPSARSSLRHPDGKKQGSEEQGSDISPDINSLEHFNPHVMKGADPRLALYRQVMNKAIRAR